MDEQRDTCNCGAEIEIEGNSSCTTCDYEERMAEENHPTEPTRYDVRLEILINPELFDNEGEVELWIEGRLSDDLDIAKTDVVSAKEL